MRTLLVGFVFCILYFVFCIAPVSAQLPNFGGVAVNIEINDSNVEQGQIISASRDGFKKSTTSYDIQMYGVVVAFPIISVKPKSDKSFAVVSTGETQVLVSTKGGAIEIGDFITSSDDAGIGQKATKPGYVLGKALQEYKDSSKNGLIALSLNPNYFGGAASGGITGSIANSITQTFSDPARSARLIRYFLAAIVAILAFILSSFAFIKFVSTGIEAVGRNPLAKRTIIASMILSGGVVVVLVVAAFGIVLTIIRTGT